jgi:hypothetical protein
MTDTPIGTAYLVPGRQALLWPEGPPVVPASACGSAAAKDDRNHHQTTGSERRTINYHLHAYLLPLEKKLLILSISETSERRI